MRPADTRRVEDGRRLQARHPSLKGQDTADTGRLDDKETGCLGAVVIAFAATLSADERLDMRRDPVVRAVDKAAGAVVNISTEKVVQRNFFGGVGAV